MKIKLRSFMFIVCASIVTLVLGLFLGQSQRLLRSVFVHLNQIHSDTVTEAAHSLLQARQFSLRTYGALLSNDNELSSELIVAKEHEKLGTLQKRLEGLKKSTQTDLLDALYSNGTPSLYPELKNASPLFHSSLKGQTGLTILNLKEQPYLVSYSPLKNYGETVGVLILGYALNGSVAEAISKATNTKITFLVGQADARTLPLEFVEKNTPSLGMRVETGVISDLDQQTRRNITWLGLISLITLFLLVYSLIEFGFMRGFREVLAGINAAADDLDRGIIREQVLPKHRIAEVSQLSGAFVKFTTSLKGFSEKIQLKSRKEAFVEVAEQVAHDLKSPLSALDMMLLPENLTSVPETRRNRISQCLQRIKDIIKVLSERKRSEQADVQSDLLTVELLPSLVEGILAEKRHQFRDKLNVELTAHLPHSGLFAAVPAGEFKRAVSNLIDNAVQSIERKGSVTVTLEAEKQMAYLKIVDTGKGIASDVLPKLGQRGFSLGKTQGSGLGLWNAKEVIRKCDGNLKIESMLGEGTEVSISLPLSKTPEWFLTDLAIPSSAHTLVLIDDEPSIHDLWRQRVGQLSLPLRLVSFTTLKDFKAWLAREGKPSGCFFLFDYEFLGNAENGLDVIAAEKLGEESVLLTSHFDKPAVQARCRELGVKLLPKEFSGFVDINVAGDR